MAMRDSSFARLEPWLSSTSTSYPLEAENWIPRAFNHLWCFGHFQSHHLFGVAFKGWVSSQSVNRKSHIFQPRKPKRPERTTYLEIMLVWTQCFLLNKGTQEGRENLKGRRFKKNALWTRKGKYLAGGGIVRGRKRSFKSGQGGRQGSITRVYENSTRKHITL